MDTTLIEVKSLSKKFSSSLRRSMLYGSVDLFRSLVGRPSYRGRLRKGEFWAVDDVNFQLKRGEVLGIIGSNGSGKSTLLRLLSGIFPPDKGEIVVNGRVGALIAVGAGFHPHMTGRENIMLNGIILGMSQEEVTSKFDEIVKFADIGDFLDAPLNTYSSGMKVRLGFSIAVHSDSDILLVDEILSVGDVQFRNKSLRKVNELLHDHSKGVVFVSHNLDQVQYLCHRVIVMERGRIVFHGDASEAIRFYEKNIFLQNKFEDTLPHQGYGMGVDLQKVYVNGQLANGGGELPMVQYDHPITIEAEISFDGGFPQSEAIFSVLDENGVPLWVVYPNEFGYSLTDFNKGLYKFKLQMPTLWMKEGKYYVNFVLRNMKTFETYEKKTRVGTFLVEGAGRQRIEVMLAPKPINYEWHKHEN